MNLDGLQRADPAGFIPRIKQVQWDHYYMEIATTVQLRANCHGAKVGAVLVAHNRIVSTGFNGTPEGFPNCLDGGCERCRQRELKDAGETAGLSPEFLGDGKHLDLCICVHAEANALLSAAREGASTEGTTLYATYKPCFTCLKEAVQARVRRVVYLQEYQPAKSESLRQQYNLLAEHLRRNDQRNFEQLARQDVLVSYTGGSIREPVLDEQLPAPAPADGQIVSAADETAAKRPAPKKERAARKPAASRPRS